MSSLASKLLVLALRAQGRKRTYRSVETLHARIRRERGARSEPPDSMKRSHRVERSRLDGCDVWVLSSRSGERGERASRRRVLYLHGGAYVFEISPFHWRFCAKLVERLDCEVTVPIYPLAPEHSAVDALRVAAEAYRAMTRAEGVHAIMGDSAGGGMALALAQHVRDSGLPAPAEVVLLSPWLDIALDHPDIDAVESEDPWLSRVGLVEAGRLYRGRGELHARDPRVSPIHGDLDGLGRIALFIGTRDILHPDAKRFYALARARGVPVRFFEYANMVHVFMLVGVLPEAKRAFADIASVLTMSEPHDSSVGDIHS